MKPEGTEPSLLAGGAASWEGESLWIGEFDIALFFRMCDARAGKF
jgi:hypothetical protein